MVSCSVVQLVSCLVVQLTRDFFTMTDDHDYDHLNDALSFHFCI